MSAETNQNKDAIAAAPSAVDAQGLSSSAPKRITNAQTVCNERNEKNKLCNGHLKQLRTGGEEAEKHLGGDDVLFKCQVCHTLYVGPPLGHVRDPQKQSRFVERELTALLQAAGGTLPTIVKNETGAYVLVEPAAAHSPAPTAARPAAAKASPGGETPEEKKARLVAEVAAQGPKAAPGGEAHTSAQTAAPKASAAKAAPIPGASGPVPGETPEQKIARLKAVSAEAKRRREAREAAEAAGELAPVIEPAQPTEATSPIRDSSPEADRHRPAAEAQAATGMGSAVPLSAAAATASPAAGAETPEDLAPDVVPTAETSAQTASPPIPGASGPVPGETWEQKLERLRGVSAAAKERAIKEGKRQA